MKGTIFYTDGRQGVAEAVHAKFTLAELQAIVGGYVEKIDIRDGHLFANEEGKRIGLPYNQQATGLIQNTHPGDTIVGDAVLVPRGGFK